MSRPAAMGGDQLVAAPPVVVLTGGFSEAELREAGADSVFGSVSELRSGIRSTRLA